MALYGRILIARAIYGNRLFSTRVCASIIIGAYAPGMYENVGVTIVGGSSWAWMITLGGIEFIFGFAGVRNGFH